jgi:hypothetical protein
MGWMPTVRNRSARFEFGFDSGDARRCYGWQLLPVCVRETDPGCRLGVRSLPDVFPRVHSVLEDVVWGGRELSVRQRHLLNQMQLGFLRRGMNLGSGSTEKSILPLSDTIKVVSPCMAIAFVFPCFEQGVETS